MKNIHEISTHSYQHNNYLCSSWSSYYTRTHLFRGSFCIFHLHNPCWRFLPLHTLYHLCRYIYDDKDKENNAKELSIVLEEKHEHTKVQRSQGLLMNKKLNKCNNQLNPPKVPKIGSSPLFNGHNIICSKIGLFQPYGVLNLCKKVKGAPPIKHGVH